LCPRGRSDGHDEHEAQKHLAHGAMLAKNHPSGDRRT
jgi:hypothetical protein